MGKPKWEGDLSGDGGKAICRATYKGKPVTAFIETYIGGCDYGYDAFLLEGHVRDPLKSKAKKIWEASSNIDGEPEDEEGEQEQEGIDEIFESSPEDAWRALGGPKLGG
jgi:hypothetical protein